MELSKGYKQTDIGLIPNQWKVVDTPEILKQNGGIKIGPFGSQLKKELLISKGFKVYGQENIFDKDMSIGDRYLTKSHFEKLKSCELKSGDFIVSMMGTIGKTFIVPEGIERGIMDSHLLRLRLNEKMLSSFLSHYFDSEILKEQVYSLSVGGIMDGLSSKIVKQIKIPLPPLPEQTAIATVLSDTDQLIQAIQKKIAKKRLIKQGAMQELLRPKEGWVERKLGDCAVLKARIGWQGLTTDEYQDSGDFGLITGTDFKNGFIDWDNCVFVEKNRFDQDKNIQIKKEDVLVTKDGTIGKVAYINQLPFPSTLNSGVFVIRPKNKEFQPHFFYHLLMSNHFDEYLGKLTAGSTISHLYQKDFVHYEFPLPGSKEEQDKIATILSDMDSEIEKFEVKLSKYKELKQGLMQNLLTGKIRLV